MGIKRKRHRDVHVLDRYIDLDEDEKDARPLKPQNNLIAKKHWENAKVKPILFSVASEEILRLLAIEKLERLERFGRANRSKNVEGTPRKPRIGAPWDSVSRAPCSIHALCGRLNRSTLRLRASMLAARTTTIKVVSVDRDVTLPVACRSTFIAVIQPRIERPTAERRNGNTQWFSCKPLRNAIDRLTTRRIVPDSSLWTIEF